MCPGNFTPSGFAALGLFFPSIGPTALYESPLGFSLSGFMAQSSEEEKIPQDDQMADGSKASPSRPNMVNCRYC